VLEPHQPLDQPIRLVVADRHAAVRDGLPLLLRDAGIGVVATAESADRLAAVLAVVSAEVALVSSGLAAGRGASALRQLIRRALGTPVLVYVDSDERDLISSAVHAGAAGVVGRGRPIAQLSRALRAVATGGQWFDEHDWSQAPLSAGAEDALRRSDGLSGAERRVLALVAAGTATEDIAAGLSVSPHTVRTHVRNLMRKLDAQSRAHAVAIAIRESAIEVA
jgi:DNA-binding NarL/FixJ family response regulator